MDRQKNNHHQQIIFIWTKYYSSQLNLDSNVSKYNTHSLYLNQNNQNIGLIIIIILYMGNDTNL